MAIDPGDTDSDIDIGLDLSSDSEQSEVSEAEQRASGGPIHPYAHKPVDSASSDESATSDSDEDTERLVNLSW